MGERPKEADNIEIPNLPDTAHFRKWKANVREAVASASRDPNAAFLWVRDVENTVDRTSLGDSSGFSTLDSKLAAALAKVLTGALGRSIDVEKEKLAQDGRLMKGREILHVIYKHFKVSEAEGHILDFQDLIAVRMHGDDLRAFLDEWELTLAGMNKIPAEEYLEPMFRSHIERHPGLKEDMAHYERLLVGHPDNNYELLVNTVRRYIELKRHQKAKAERNRGNGRPAAPATEKKGLCFQFQKGQCNKGDDCPYRHEKDPKGRSPSRTPGKGKGGKGKKGGKPQRGRSPSRDKPDVCKFYLQGRCTRGKDCAFRHPKPCKYFQEGTCKRGDRCTFAHVKVSAPAGQHPSSSQSDMPRETSSAPDKRNTEGTAEEPSKNRSRRGRSRSPENKPKNANVIIRETTRNAMTLLPMPRETSSKTVRFSRKVERVMIEVPNADEMIRYVDKKRTFSDSYTEPTPTEIKASAKRARHRAKQLKREVERFAAPAVSVVAEKGNAEFPRVWILDTGSCVDLVRRDELSPQEAGRITSAEIAQNLLTANGPTRADQEVSLRVNSCGANTQALVMDDSPSVLSLGKLVQDMKFLLNGSEENDLCLRVQKAGNTN